MPVAGGRRPVRRKPLEGGQATSVAVKARGDGQPGGDGCGQTPPPELAYSISNFIVSGASRECRVPSVLRLTLRTVSESRTAKCRVPSPETSGAPATGVKTYISASSPTLKMCCGPGAQPRRFGRGLSGHTLACRACHESRSAGRREPTDGRRMKGKLPLARFRKRFRTTCHDSARFAESDLRFPATVL